MIGTQLVTVNDAGSGDLWYQVSTPKASPVFIEDSHFDYSLRFRSI